MKEILLKKLKISNKSKNLGKQHYLKFVTEELSNYETIGVVRFPEEVLSINNRSRYREEIIQENNDELLLGSIKQDLYRDALKIVNRENLDNTEGFNLDTELFNLDDFSDDKEDNNETPDAITEKSHFTEEFILNNKTEKPVSQPTFKKYKFGFFNFKKETKTKPNKFKIKTKPKSNETNSLPVFQKKSKPKSDRFKIEKDKPFEKPDEIIKMSKSNSDKDIENIFLDSETYRVGESLFDLNEQIEGGDSDEFK